MARLKYNGLTATLGAPLTSSDTTITFAAPLTHSGSTPVPTITGADYIPLTILASSDPDSAVVEIVNLTAYTTGATSGTIARAQESTTAVAHTTGVVVVHGPTTADFGAGAGGSSRVLLKETTLASAAASIAFTSSDIPTSGYNHLELLVVARSTKAAVGDELYLAINGDTTAANYKQQRLYGASATAGATTSATNRIGYIEAASDPAGSASSVQVQISHYRGSWHKVARVQSSKLGDPIVEINANRWTNTAAVTSLTFTCLGGNLAAGSAAWLYGLL